MPTVTATQIMTDAFRMLNVYQPGDAITAADSTDALRWLNLMIGQWAQIGLTIPAESRTVFPLVSGKGSSTNPYSVGAGGDLNMTKPPNQSSVTGAGLLLNASTPPIELPRAMMTNESYDHTRIKDLNSALFTTAFYLPTYANSLGQLFLWPVPTDLTNSLVLYTRTGLGTFADLTTAYSIPDGYDEALYGQLALRLAIPFGRTVPPELKELALLAFNTIKRSNIQLSDLENDFATLGGGRGGRGFNLQTGEG